MTLSPDKWDALRRAAEAAHLMLSNQGMYDAQKWSSKVWNTFTLAANPAAILELLSELRGRDEEIASLRDDLRHYTGRPFTSSTMLEQVENKDFATYTDEEIESFFELGENCACQHCVYTRYVLSLRAELRGMERGGEGTVDPDYVYLIPQLPHLRDELEKMWHGAVDEYRAWLYRDSMRAVKLLISKLATLSVTEGVDGREK